MTLFLTALFIVFLVFPPEISYLALAFLIFGDLFSKLVGIRFGRTPLYRRKTLQGTLGFYTGGVMTGTILHLIFPEIPLLFVVTGALAAAMAELLTDRINDNFTVGILSGGFLMALKVFLGL